MFERKFVAFVQLVYAINFFWKGKEHGKVPIVEWSIQMF